DTIDSISEMRILTTKTGVMSCRLNISEIIEENASLQSQEEMDIEDSQAKRNRELKLIFEQAIFRNNDHNVPVSCTLSSDFKGDINKVVLELSDEILDSSSQYLDESVDLKSQLHERHNKMALLIQFIRNSNVIDKLHPSTRQRLFWNAEKMACVKKLWSHHNASYSPLQDGAEGPCRKLLNGAIYGYFQDRNFQSQNEDLARFFYRYRVRDLGTIFTYIQRVIENYMDADDRNIMVFEANTIILLAFEAAFDFRRMNKELYAITSNESKDSWTFQPELLKVIHQQFEETDAAIRSFTVQQSSQTVNDSLQYTGQGVNDYNKVQTKDTRIETLKDQMVNLADVLLGATTERLI
ncbi:23_t:CDS:10, partial [Cetraspora pellucida]